MTRAAHDAVFSARRGRGLVQGRRCDDADAAADVIATASEMGLVAETAGVESEVLNGLPAAIITGEELSMGLDIVGRCRRQGGRG